MGAGSDADPDADRRADPWARETAPQSPYTTRQVGLGVVVLVVGLALAFGLPLALL